MQTVKQGQLTLALLSRIPPRLRIYCLLLHWEFYTKPKKLLPASTIFFFSKVGFFPSSPPFFLPPSLVPFYFAGASHQDWAMKCVAAGSFYSAWTLFSDVCGYQTYLAKKKNNPKPSLRAGKRMGILRERVRGQRVYSHPPAWDSAWTGGIGGSVDVGVCGWGRKRLRNVLETSVFASYSRSWSGQRWHHRGRSTRRCSGEGRIGTGASPDPQPASAIGVLMQNDQWWIVLNAFHYLPCSSASRKKLSIILNLQISRTLFFPEDWQAF